MGFVYSKALAGGLTAVPDNTAFWRTIVIADEVVARTWGEEVDSCGNEPSVV